MYLIHVAKLNKTDGMQLWAENFGSGGLYGASVRYRPYFG